MNQQELTPEKQHQYENGFNWGIDILKQLLFKGENKMSAYEGSKMQENDQDKNQKFLGHINDPKEARKEKDAETDYYNTLMFKTFEKANKLEYADFLGWMKGEDLIVIKNK